MRIVFFLSLSFTFIYSFLSFVFDVDVPMTNVETIIKNDFDFQQNILKLKEFVFKLKLFLRQLLNTVAQRYRFGVDDTKLKKVLQL